MENNGMQNGNNVSSKFLIWAGLYRR
jgi:hypothetical protein